MRVLIVEDSDRLREGLTKALDKAGYAVDSARDGTEGLWAANENDYDAIILDIMLPEIDGLEILSRLRAAGSLTPILLLTARDTIPDRVTGLRAGADDYLVKPFALEELLARVEAICRRGYQASHNIIRVGSLDVDASSRRACVDGRELPLTAREYALLEYLARRGGEIATREEIEAHIYDDLTDLMSNAVDSAVCALRRKLKKAGASPLIHTRRGFGYVLDSSEALGES